MVGKNSDAVLVAATALAASGRVSLGRRPCWPRFSTARTGIALSVGSLMLVWWLVAAATGPEAFATVQNFLGSPLGLADAARLDGLVVLPPVRPACGIWHGIMGSCLPSTSLNPVSYLVLALTAVATALVWVRGLYENRRLGRWHPNSTDRRCCAASLGGYAGLVSAKSGLHHWKAERDQRDCAGAADGVVRGRRARATSASPCRWWPPGREARSTPPCCWR